MNSDGQHFTSFEPSKSWETVPWLLTPTETHLSIVIRTKVTPKAIQEEGRLLSISSGAQERQDCYIWTFISVLDNEIINAAARENRSPNATFWWTITSRWDWRWHVISSSVRMIADCLDIQDLDIDTWKSADRWADLSDCDSNDSDDDLWEIDWRTFQWITKNQ
jgi:hypothetical protein